MCMDWFKDLFIDEVKSIAGKGNGGYGGSGGSGPSIQSDWNQNDENAPDYVKNRPFWTSDPVEEEIVPLQNFTEYLETFEAPDGFQYGVVELEIGSDYSGSDSALKVDRFYDGAMFKVVFNNNEYILPFVAGGSLGSISCDQFIVDFYGGGGIVDPVTGITTPIVDGAAMYIRVSGTVIDHTVQIFNVVQQVHQINPAFVPSDESKMNRNAPVSNGPFSNGRLDGSSIGSYSFAFGRDVTASSSYSFAIGSETVAAGVYSHAEGDRTVVAKNTDISPALDFWDTSEPLEGRSCHVEGHKSISTGHASHAEGLGTWVKKVRAAHSEGYQTIAGSNYQHVQGKFNVEDAKNTYAHIVGNGTSDTARSNAHTLAWDGTATFAGAVTGAGADYAEYFEWADGNPDAEDRIGLAVTLEGDKIRLANAEDDILGVVTGTAMIIGDNAEWEWRQKYLVDNYGRVVTEMVEEFEGKLNEETGEMEKVSIGFSPRPKMNPEFDSTKDYVRRSDRPEWETVGMLGKIHVTDDGTCVVGGYAAVSANGIVTASIEKTNMRVMKRITDNVVLVLMK